MASEESNEDRSLESKDLRSFITERWKKGARWQLKNEAIQIVLVVILGVVLVAAWRLGWISG